MDSFMLWDRILGLITFCCLSLSCSSFSRKMLRSDICRIEETAVSFA
jgi:hypothetical protein